MRANRLPAPGARRPDSTTAPVGSGVSRVRTILAISLVLVGAIGSAACRQDMHQAPRYDPLEKSDFFADGRASRPLVEGTVARGNLREDKVFYTGREGNQVVSQIPVPVTKELLVRGQERFNIYCSPCHSRVGDGNGMIVQRGFKRPPSFHEPRVRDLPIGHYYDVITNGFGAMSDYAAQVQPQDRWAIAAYIRVLQFSQNAPATALSDDDRRRIETGQSGQGQQGAPEGQAGERSGTPHKGGGAAHE